MTEQRPAPHQPSAREDREKAAHVEPSPQTTAPSYRLAFDDTDFLARPELRPVRLQLELLKPELALAEAGVSSTVVAFGSARIPAPEDAARLVEETAAAARAAPDDARAAHRARAAGRLAEKTPFYELAREFARLISVAGQQGVFDDYVVITGGGGGIMEAANRGAHDVGAKSIGLNIVLPHEQAPNPYITPELCFQFHYFALRKMHFLMRARALAIFPGGFGTLDELFDALTLMQTGRMDVIPVVLFGRAFWRRIIDFEAMAEEGTIAEEDLRLIRYAETAEEGCAIIRRFYEDPPG